MVPSEYRRTFLDKTLGLFDAVVSFSSIEHSGLGRYGDTLNPWGDLIVVARAWCVTKTNGSLVLGVLYDLNGDYITFNAHRCYDEAGIQGRKVNHSARKTGITTLIHAGVQNTLVQQHSGHKSLSSINNYSSASFQQQKDMSKVLCTFTSNQDSTTDMNQNTIQPGDSTANLNNVDTIPDDDDDMVLVRASQEMIENTLLDIENFENYEVLDIHNDIHVDNCKKSSNLVQKTLICLSVCLRIIPCRPFFKVLL
ncbi:unnamed protein product [Mytilus edulis]|uniref:Uncharacterized protein n=1 Tax=Mytilus edulis TaxID=6550 RepID=A0A8S3SJJ1_MYTED|nr:unnamed protein product [Mytilus edulis]